jgi:nucleoside-diphosphate-sugar epimerase
MRAPTLTNILVTGGTGFIGRNLLYKLSQLEHNVVAIWNTHPGKDFGPKILWHPVSRIRELETKFDYVFHLAAFYTQSFNSKNVNQVIDSNVMFTKTVLEIAESLNSHVLMTSSYMQLPSHEGSNPYIDSKKLASHLASALARESSITLTEVILHDTYGPCDTRPKILNSMIQSVKSGSSVDLENPNKFINLSYIDDIIETLYMEMKEKTKGVIEIKGPHDVQLCHIPEIIKKLYLKEDILESENLHPTSRGNEIKNLRICRTNLIEGISKLIESES